MAADAQYAINIASRMSDGGETISQLDALSAKLTGGGKNADFFQTAIQRVGVQLGAASSATREANAWLAEGNDLYRQLEKNANTAAKAVEASALKNGYASSKTQDLSARSLDASAALAAHVEKLKLVEAHATKASAAEAALANTQRNLGTLSGHVNKSIAAQAEGIEKLRFGLTSAGGSAGALASGLLAPVQGFAKLSGEMGSTKAAALLAAAGFAALTVAALALVAAVVVGVVALASWAVGLADSARAAALHTEALVAMDPALSSVTGSLGALTADTGLSRTALEGLAESLRAAKVSAADMPAALRAAALAEAALGNGGAAKFTEQLKASTLAVGDFAKQSESKFGGIVARQLLGLDAQTKRFHGNLAGLFGGLNIDPALGALHTLVSLFDESTAAGQALKFLFEALFQPLIDQARNAAYVVEAFYLGVLIGATKMYIAVKPAIKAVADLLGFHDTKLADTLDFAKKAGELLAPVFLAIAGAIGLLLVPFVALLAVPVASMAIWAGAFWLVKTAITGLVEGFTTAWNFISGLDFGQLGADIIAGLVNGLLAGAGAVVKAIGGVVGGAIDHAKSLLGIASPSKVFGAIADNTVAGFTDNLDAGAADAQAAMTGVVSPEAAKQAALSGDVGALASLQSPAPAAPAAQAPGGKGGGSIDLAGATFNFYGVKDAEGATASFGEMLTRLLEGDALQAGDAVLT